MKRQFRDRVEAGRLLAEKLLKYAGRDDLIVLGLPRGGVPVAFEVARKLKAPLDVFVVRKLGVPGHHELAMGAIASGGVEVVNRSLMEEMGISKAAFNAVAAQETRELERRESAYRGKAAPLDLEAKTVLLVDDGIATGSTMRAAVAAIRKFHPTQIVVAVPTASAQAYREFKQLADEAVAFMAPEEFYAVGQFYENFGQTSDAEVTLLLREAQRRPKENQPELAEIPG